MRAVTRVEVGLRPDGVAVVRRMRCEVPLLVRVDGASDDTMLELLVVGGAAGPLGGDELELTLVVRPGASVRVRSVAATLAQPGPTAAASISRTRIEVGDGATLDWALQPTVSVDGSRHRAVTELEAASSATVSVAESVQLGRFGEPSGELALRQRVVVGGSPVLDHETVFAPDARSGPGGHGSFRWVTSRVVVSDGVASVPAVEVGTAGVRAVFPLAPRCALETAAAATSSGRLD